MLLVEGTWEEVASRLTKLVGLPEVVVSPSDTWMPYGKPVLKDGSWDTTPAREVILSQPNCLVPPSIQRQFQTWWLAVPKRANAPNWDIASTCSIKGKPGLLLVEAKAHEKELSAAGKSRPTTQNSIRNHDRIGAAIAKANEAFQSMASGDWALSRDHHYQLSNRFAWSWKLASLGIPVVLLYFGFLNAQDMAGDGPLFPSEAEWTRALKDHCQDVVPETCWGEWVYFADVPLVPLIRGVKQPLAE